MRNLIDLCEQIDEVNYFLREWQRVSRSSLPVEQDVSKPELKFVARVLKNVIDKAEYLDIPVILKTGDQPIVGRADKKPARKNHKPGHNWLIPSKSTINVTAYKEFKFADGKQMTLIGNNNGMVPLKIIAQAISSGGRLKLATKSEVW